MNNLLEVDTAHSSSRSVASPSLDHEFPETTQLHITTLSHNSNSSQKKKKRGGRKKKRIQHYSSNMKKSLILNSALAFVVGLYFAGTIVYHQRMYEWLFIVKHHIPELTGLSAETLLSKSTTYIIYCLLASLALWFWIYATDTDRFHSMGILCTALTIWFSRICILQPLYLAASQEAPEFAMLLASIVAFVPIVLLIVGPETIIIDEEDQGKMTEQMRKVYERRLKEQGGYIDVDFGDPDDPANMDKLTVEDQAMMGQYENLLATIGKDVEKQGKKKKLKKIKIN
jgi:hypothetical protein